MKPLISICICTYQREKIAETLRSLAELESNEQYETEVVVADNDAVPSAKERVEALTEETGLNTRYVHAPKQNISLARNACLDHAQGDWVAFVDDDETVCPAWLTHLFSTAQKTDSDIVFGPVWGRYPEDAPSWQKKLNFHSTYITTENPQTGYSGNVLMNVGHEAIAGRRFDLARGRTGGEDTKFFFDCRAAGAKLQYEARAEAYEAVVPSKLSLRWMVRAKFRSGQSYGELLAAEQSLPKKAVAVAASLLKSSVFAIGTVLLCFSPHRSASSLMRASFHAGVAAAYFEIGQEEMYVTAVPAEK